MEAVSLFAQRADEEEVPSTESNSLFLLLISDHRVLVNGVPVRCLWDAMSTRSVITDTCAKQLGLEVEEHASSIKFQFAAEASSVCERKRTANVRITVKDDNDDALRVAFNVNVIASTRIDAFPLVLGKDVHSLLSNRFNLHINFDSNVITLDIGDKRLQHTARDGSRESEAIFTVSTVETPFTFAERLPTNTDGAPEVQTEADPHEEADFRAREARIREEFTDVFNPLQDGQGRLVLPGLVTIEFTKEGPPPMTLPRKIRFSPVEAEFLDKRFEELERTGVIARTTTATHLSPFFLVQKAGSTSENPRYREIIDMRALNQRVVPILMHTPLIDNLLEDAANSRIFSTLDLSEAFWSVPIAEEYKDWFSFIDHRQRVWRFEVCPFGFTNSPAIFSNALETAMRTVPTSSKRYCDDLLCHTDLVDPHETELRLILGMLRKYRLHVNSKSKLFRLRVEYVGHWLSHNAIAPILEHKTLEEWPLPTSQTAMRSLLGFANFHRNFVPRLGVICAPLYELTGKHHPYVLEEKHVAAFHELKAALMRATALHPPSRAPGTRTRLYVDASQVGSGAFLQQLFDGVWYPVGYATKLFNKRQQQYSAIVREALGIVHGIQRFQHIFRHQKIEVYSDQKPLIEALNGNPEDPRWRRVLSELLQLDFKLHHVAGECNLADVFSRPSTLDVAESTLENWQPDTLSLYAVTATTEPLTDDAWCTALAEDPTAAKIIRSLTSEDSNAEYFQRKYRMEDGLLYFSDPLGRKRLYVPTDRVVRVLAHFHDSAVAGHPGTERMLQEMASIVYMRKMAKEVRRYVQSCDTCSRSKPKKDLAAAAQSLEIPARPFQHVSIDLFTSLPAVKGHDAEDRAVTYDSIFTITCLLTRAVAFLPTSIHLTGAGAARLILETWAVGRNLGYPESIVSDRDVRFMSSDFKAAMAALKVRLRTSTSRSAETNGATEVFHRTLKSYLIAYCLYEPKSWVAHLPYAEASLNNGRNRSTGYAAQELVVGYKPSYTGNQHLVPEQATEEDSRSVIIEDMRRHHATALQCARDELNDTRDSYVLEQTPHRTPLILKPGDFVYVDTAALIPTELRDAGHKIKARFAGPFLCVKKVTNGSYKIDIPHTSRAHNVISHKFLKKAYRNEFAGRPMQPTIPRSALEPGTFEVEAIMGHEVRKRQYFFKVKWLTFDDTHCTFEPLASFTDSKNNVITESLRQYIKTHNLPIPT